MRPVLIVDDDPNVRYFFGKVLQDYGLVVIEASDVTAARPLIKHCAIALLDITMPGMNGDQFLEQLRTSGDRTPVVVFTGCRPQGDLIAKLDRVEALEVLEKPMRSEDFPQVIDYITDMVKDIYDLDAVSERLRDYIARQR